MIDKDIFEDLFVLEIANNHLGSVERGLKIIGEFAQVVRFNNVRATMKLQFRDVEQFVHRDFRELDDRYIQKTLSTRLTDEEYATLVKAVRQAGCMPTATPFDERSVDLCVELGIPDDQDRQLRHERLDPDRKDRQDQEAGDHLHRRLVVEGPGRCGDVLREPKIPLAINHCVSIYPTEDSKLELNQIDFLRNRYPNNTIGFSTHEYSDWSNSILIAYAKGRADI